MLGARLDAEPLVVLLGPPGVGKTRLAHELALRHVAGTYANGAWLCDLTDAGGIDGMCAALCAVLHVPLADRDSAQTIARLGDALGARGRVLLILDNFEHLVAHAPETLAVFRKLAPEARILVTSRVRTDIEGESVIDLGPLTLPQAADVAASDAVALFVARAQLVQPAYALTPDEAPRVAALVRELDGLPLALELAAARMRVFSAATLLTHLHDRFEVLRRTGGASGRHASLRGAVEAAWNALEPLDQAALAQCSVFRGGFDLEAAEGVLDLGEGAPPVADVLQTLRDRSFVAREEALDGSGARFTLYLTIRDYAWEKLCASGGAAAAEARHTAYFLDEGSAWAAKADGREGPEALSRLLAETENLLAVHRRALDPARPALEDATRAALALAPALMSHGPLPLAAALLDAVRAAAARTGAPLSAKLLAARAEFHRLMGSYASGAADAEEACAIATRTGDRDTLASALLTRALVNAFRPHMAEARDDLRRAAGVAASGPPWIAARVLTMGGILEESDGAMESARATFAKALRLHVESGDLRFEGMAEAHLCLTCIHLGRFEEAHDHGERGVAISRAMNNRRHVAGGLINLADVAAELGREEEWQALLAEACHIAREMGDRLVLGIGLGQTGMRHFLAGRHREAREAYRAALDSLRGQPTTEMVLHAWIGGLEAETGRITASREAFDEAERHPWAHERPETAEVIRLLRGHLDLALAREANAAGDERAAAARAGDAERRLGEPPPRAVKLEVRLARRSLERALSELATRSGKGGLVVQSRGEWFRLPSGERVDCAKRRVLCRLLVSLTAHRLDAPGAPLSTTALVAAGWPGERVPATQAAGRLQVAMSTLRKLGLRDLLQSHPRGYLLDALVPASFAPADSGPTL